MARFETAEAAVRLEKIRRLIRKQNMTVAEVASALDVSKPLATHYLRHLSDLKEIKVVNSVSAGMYRTPTNLWGWIEKPKPAKPQAGKARIVNPPRRDVVTLTRWIGGNPFERMTANGA
jgi:predicted ArsR family transcriptional regulator